MPVKLEWQGYCTVKKLWQYVEPFSSDTVTTDRRMDRIAISIFISAENTAAYVLHALHSGVGVISGMEQNGWNRTFW